jgi:hypothetical protein
VYLRVSLSPVKNSTVVKPINVAKLNIMREKCHISQNRPSPQVSRFWKFWKSYNEELSLEILWILLGDTRLETKQSEPWLRIPLDLVDWEEGNAGDLTIEVGCFAHQVSFKTFPSEKAVMWDVPLFPHSNVLEVRSITFSKRI